MEILLSLVQNFYVFAWRPYKVPEVNLAFITYKLNADPLVPLKKQKPKRSAKPHIEAVKEKVEKLKQARAIKELYFPKWLSKTVVVKKKMGNGGFTLNLLILIEPAQRIPSPYLRLTN